MGFAAIHAAELVTFVSTVHCSYGCPLIPNVLEYVLQRMSWSCTDPCAVLMDDLLEVLALAHQTVTQYPFLPRNLDRVSSCWKNTDSWLVCSTAKKLKNIVWVNMSGFHFLFGFWENSLDTKGKRQVKYSFYSFTFYRFLVAQGDYDWLTIDLLHSKKDVWRALQWPSFRHSLGIFPSWHIN